MKPRAFWQLVGFLLVIAFPGYAQLHDVQITADRKKLDEQKSRVGGPVTVTTKELIYQITLQNKRSAPFSDVQVKYMVFISDAIGGSTEKGVPISHRGAETLQDLPGNKPVTFETQPFKLATEELDAGWIHTSGAPNRARDRVLGIWIRAYADGKLIGEYANPPSIPRKFEWRE